MAQSEVDPGFSELACLAEALAKAGEDKTRTTQRRSYHVEFKTLRFHHSCGNVPARPSRVFARGLPLGLFGLRLGHFLGRWSLRSGIGFRQSRQYKKHVSYLPKSKKISLKDLYPTSP